MVVKPTSCMHLPRERKDTKRKRNHAAVFYALTGIEGVLSKTPAVYQQAGTLTLTIRAHALRSRRTPCYSLLPTCKFSAFPPCEGGYRMFYNLILAHNSHSVGEMSPMVTEREGWVLFILLSKCLSSLDFTPYTTQYVICHIKCNKK